MDFILEGIFKGYVQWIYSLCLEMVQYIANSLLDVFQMDLSYFQSVAPVTNDILNILISVGWALLLGNLVFQAMKSMAAGLGFEGEDPKLLFTRTFVFAFLLLASQQICEIGLGISAQVMEMLQIPTSVTITIPDESNFNIGSSWLLIIIVGFVVMWQFVKLCFEVAERYVVTAILVLMAPLAFGMGGSKNTEDIFKGWCRMFGSMCVMMVMNVIFLKLLISALGYAPSGVAVLPWMLLIVGIARVARKIDSIIARVGLNPALTGDGLGRGLPGMVAYAVVKGIGSSIAKAAGHSIGSKIRQGGGSGGSSSEPRANPRTPPPPPPSGGNPGGAGTPSGPAGASQQAGTQTDARFASTQSGVFASRQAAQNAAPNTEEVPQGSGHTTGVEQPAAERKGGKAPTVHTHGTRRSSVPPEARGPRSTRPYTGVFIRTGSVNNEGSKGTLGHSATSKDGTLRPPVAPPHDLKTSKRPASTAGTRKSTIMSGATAMASTERTAHTSTRETLRERPSLQQGRTPKIPTPPGVGGGEKPDAHPPFASAGTVSHSTDAVSHMSGAASAVTEDAVARPPFGSRKPPENGAPTPGMAGIRAHVGGDPSHGGKVSFSGTAGRYAASSKSHAPSGGEGVLPDMAGTPRSTAGSARISHVVPPTGTAGTISAAGHEVHSAASESSLSGTAGMRRPGKVGGPSAKAKMPSAASAGTAPQGADISPKVNRGTRRMKGGVPPTPGGLGKASKTRKKRSES